MEHIRFVGRIFTRSGFDRGGRERTRRVGRISRRDCQRPCAINKLCDRLGRSGKPLAFCYEAGPCGYGLSPTHKHLGHWCDVVASKKAMVEVAVQIAQRWILARLRNQRFFSHAELNDAACSSPNSTPARCAASALAALNYSRRSTGRSCRTIHTSLRGGSVAAPRPAPVHIGAFRLETVPDKDSNRFRPTSKSANRVCRFGKSPDGHLTRIRKGYKYLSLTIVGRMRI